MLFRVHLRTCFGAYRLPSCRRKPVSEVGGIIYVKLLFVFQPVAVRTRARTLLTVYPHVSLLKLSHKTILSIERRSSPLSAANSFLITNIHAPVLAHCIRLTFASAKKRPNLSRAYRSGLFIKTHAPASCQLPAACLAEIHEDPANLCNSYINEVRLRTRGFGTRNEHKRIYCGGWGRGGRPKIDTTLSPVGTRSIQLRKLPHT